MLPVHRELADFLEVLFRLLPQDFENRSLSRNRLAIDEVHDLALRLTGDTAMRRLDKALESRGMPVVTAGHSCLVVHALLDDDPLPIARHNEAVQIELKTVADGIVIDPGGKPAGADQLVRVQAGSLSDRYEFVRRLP